MEKDIKIGFVGGDMRQIYAAKSLAEKGYEVALCGLENCPESIGLCTRCTDLTDALEKSDVLVLPLPVSHDGININAPLAEKSYKLDDVLELFSGKMILYGGTGQKIEQFCKNKGKLCVDYSKREDFQVLNAEPTSEGAIAIAIDGMTKTLKDSVCLCIGYGRIGKILTKQLSAFGATVYASARKNEALAWAELEGHIPIHTNDIINVLPKCDLIINTVPKTILKDELLDEVRKDALIIDLASKPGGIDFKPAKEKGLNVIWALSLPGKTAPVSAGTILAETLCKIMEESGITE